MIPELGIVVKSMAAAARSVSMMFLLIVVIMYASSVILTQWVKTPERYDKCIGQICFKEYYGSTIDGMLTLLQMLVFDDSLKLFEHAGGIPHL